MGNLVCFVSPILYFLIIGSGRGENRTLIPFGVRF